MRTDPRRGFTLVELLVVITIIGMLMALLIPAVGAVRGRMRTAACLNNMRQVGMGILNYESSKQRFPGYAQSVKRAPNVWVSVQSGGGGAATLSDAAFQDAPNANVSRISWAGVISPYVDQQATWDAAVELDNQFPVRREELFICPSDSELMALADNAGLSYVVNAGSWDYASSPATDLDASGDFIVPAKTPPPGVGDSEDNGLFHNHVAGRSNVKTRLSDIRDGAGDTLLLSENIHKNSDYNWFGVSAPAVPEQYFGMVWVVATDPSTESGVTYQAPIGREPTIVFDESKTDFARPAANHGGVFNVVFADGGGRSLGDDIDYTIYQQLMTPNQRKCVDPMNHGAVAGTPIAAFRNMPPISQSDLD